MVRLAERLWSEDKGSDAVDWTILGAGVLMLVIALFAVIDAGTDVATDAVHTPAATIADA